MKMPCCGTEIESQSLSGYSQRLGMSGTFCPACDQALDREAVLKSRGSKNQAELETALEQAEKVEKLLEKLRAKEHKESA